MGQASSSQGGSNRSVVHGFGMATQKNAENAGTLCTVGAGISEEFWSEESSTIIAFRAFSRRNNHSVIFRRFDLFCIGDFIMRTLFPQVTHRLLAPHVPILRRRTFSTFALLRQQQQQQQQQPQYQPPTPKKKLSPHASFYAQFTRPLLKVLTLSFLTYQIVYWAWIKLENEGLKHEKSLEVKGLEDEVRAVAAGKRRRLLDDHSDG